MKRCPKCKIEKPESEFYTNSKTKDRLGSHCKTCVKVGKRNDRRANPDVVRDRERWIEYSITYLDILYMLKAQNYKCSICGKLIGEKDALDHDHITKRVRGILHRECNASLGDISINEARLLYLRKHLPLDDYQI